MMERMLESERYVDYQSKRKKVFDGVHVCYTTLQCYRPLCHNLTMLRIK